MIRNVQLTRTILSSVSEICLGVSKSPIGHYLLSITLIWCWLWYNPSNTAFIGCQLSVTKFLEISGVGRAVASNDQKQPCIHYR